MVAAGGAGAEHPPVHPAVLPVRPEALKAAAANRLDGTFRVAIRASPLVMSPLRAGTPACTVHPSSRSAPAGRVQPPESSTGRGATEPGPG